MKSFFTGLAILGSAGMVEAIKQCKSNGASFPSKSGTAFPAQIQSGDASRDSQLKNIKSCLKSFGGATVLGSLDMTFSGQDSKTYSHRSGIIDRSTCRTVDIPTDSDLVAYQGYYAVTKCCPLVSGFKLKFASGAIVSVGTTPSAPIVAKATSSAKAKNVKAAAAFQYKNTEWRKAEGSLIGYGGASGGAWDSLYLVFNKCGPRFELKSLQKLLKAKTSANLALTKIVGQTKVLVAKGVADLKKNQKLAKVLKQQIAQQTTRTNAIPI